MANTTKVYVVDNDSVEYREENLTFDSADAAVRYYVKENIRYLDSIITVYEYQPAELDMDGLSQEWAQSIISDIDGDYGARDQAVPEPNEEVLRAARVLLGAVLELVGNAQIELVDHDGVEIKVAEWIKAHEPEMLSSNSMLARWVAEEEREEEEEEEEEEEVEALDLRLLVVNSAYPDNALTTMPDAVQKWYREELTTIGVPIVDKLNGMLDLVKATHAAVVGQCRSWGYDGMANILEEAQNADAADADSTDEGFMDSEVG